MANAKMSATSQAPVEAGELKTGPTPADACLASSHLGREERRRVTTQKKVPQAADTKHEEEEKKAAEVMADQGSEKAKHLEGIPVAGAVAEGDTKATPLCSSPAGTAEATTKQPQEETHVGADPVTNCREEDQSEKMEFDSAEDIGMELGVGEIAEEVTASCDTMDEEPPDETNQTSGITSSDSKEKQITQKLDNGMMEPAGEQKRAVPSGAESHTISTVKIKDEPLDEEYEQALATPATTKDVKDEPDSAEEFVELQKTPSEFKISAVFSMGQDSTAAGAAANPPAGTTPPKATRSASGQASASSLCVICSGCKKVLLKGQTAYQRKGFPQLFCSTTCLTKASSPLVKASVKKSCHCCLKEIFHPKDIIIAPVDSSGAVKDFCSQRCLTDFNRKRDAANFVLSEKRASEQPEVPTSSCSMCHNLCKTRHEVTYMNTIQAICSDSCFVRFCSNNKLTINCCINCNSFCYIGDSKTTSLRIDGTTKKFCSKSCVSEYKTKSQKPVPCMLCRALCTLATMVEDADAEGNRELFCSAACVTARKVQSASSSGASKECNHCLVVTVPQYHLAMSDGSIRNFCSLNCVVAFQDAFNKNSQTTQSSAVTSQVKSSPAAPHPHADVTPKAGRPKLLCRQCRSHIQTKPELVQYKGKMYTLCDKICTEEFRKVNAMTVPCVYCKIEKVVKEVKRINNADRSFCSEGCKLLYKHDLVKRWGKKHCKNCMYCGSTSLQLVTGLFADKTEEFCSNECLSFYTLLFCQVAKCSFCNQAEKMKESLKWFGEMKHFCSLSCLLEFCARGGNEQRPVKTSTAPPTPTQVTLSVSTGAVSQGAKETTPVIANVMSLSSATNGQAHAVTNTALQATVPEAPVKMTGSVGTQADAGKPLPPPPPRILKNKALLCKPLTQTKSTLFKPSTATTGIQTDDSFPKILVLPIPVPVYVPVPMNLYSQCTPQPLGLPLPVPVPMFLPTTLDSAEKIVETIQKIKEKIPENPVEAELILMAEMVAEDEEKEKPVSHGDQANAFGEEFDLEAPSSMRSEEESGSGQGPDMKPPPSTASEPQMDLEADYPVEYFDRIVEQQKTLKQEQQQQQQTSPVQRRQLRKRARDSLPQRKRQARKKPPVAEAVPEKTKPKVNTLHHEYGVNAWRTWVRWRNTQPHLEFGPRVMKLKEDLVQCSTAELSFGLCKFIYEARRPNGDAYSPDSIFYLCLGIQQHLFESGRMENIFADLFYSKFTQDVSKILKDWQPMVTPSGYIHSRVEEEYLWECKQLGAYSPSVLLNTLLYFVIKFFHFKTVEQHRSLSFGHVMRCTRPLPGGKSGFLRFYPPAPKDGKRTRQTENTAKRKREEEEEEEGGVLEMKENTENPLRCPVKLYEFYLSKCSSLVKQRSDMFYLRPERSCVSNSPLWFSTSPMGEEDLDGMLTRLLTVRQLHLQTGRAEAEPPTG